MTFTVVIASIILIVISLFYLIGSAYVIKKYDGFRVFYNGLNQLFDYKGRTGRIEYACFALLVASISVVIDGVFSLLNNLPEIFSYIINSIFTLSTLLVTARRLHDLGYSGWLQTPIVLISIYSDSVDFEKTGLGGVIILLLVMIGFELFLMFKEGQNNPNKYGEKPSELTYSNSNQQV